MLTSRQKKYIRKNARKLPLKELAQKLNISPEELKIYLKNAWSEDKYYKYFQKTQPVNLPAPGLKNWFKKNWYVILGFIFLVFAVYANGLNGAFVSDDVNWIPKNPNIGNVKYLFQGNDRPATLFVFHFAHLIGDLNPFFYRLPNVFFHAGNVILIFLLLGWLYNKQTAVFASLIFAVHPILIESVTWIAGGSYSAYTFFFLLSFIFYLLAKKNAWLYLLTISFFLISLSFSEKAVVLFLIYPLYEIAFGTLIKKWKVVLPYLAVGIFVAVGLFSKIAGKINGLKVFNYVQPGIDNSFFKVPIAITEYLRLMFWPSDLSLYRSELIFTWTEYFIRLAIFLAVIIVICISYWRLRGGRISSALLFWKDSRVPSELFKTERLIFFWLSLFIVTLLPVLTPLRIASTVAERYVYMGTIGVFTAVAIALDGLANNKKLKYGVYVVLAVSILALSIRTVVRNRDWANEDNLWIASARVSPNDPNVLNNLGDMYYRQKNYQKSIESFEKAIKLVPNYADAYNNLANTQLALFIENNDQKYLNDATANYLQSIKYNPLLWQPHQSLGIIYYNLKEFSKAIEEFNQAVKINPTNINLQYNLGLIYLNSGDSNKAKEVFSNALKLDPKNQAILNILNQIK